MEELGSGMCAEKELTLMDLLDKSKMLMGRIDDASKQYDYTLDKFRDPFSSQPKPEQLDKVVTRSPKTYLEYLNLTIDQMNESIGDIEVNTRTLSTIIE